MTNPTTNVDIQEILTQFRSQIGQLAQDLAIERAATATLRAELAAGAATAPPIGLP